jgi:glycosyltransferase involved in cell wall biosynthesis
VELPGAQVSLIAPDPPDVAEWRRRFGIEVDGRDFEWVVGHDDAVTGHSADLDLLVAMTNDVPPLSHAARSVAVVQFPVRARDRISERLLGAALSAAGRRRAPAALASYDTFVAYSRFAADWTMRRLGVAGVEVIPPGVALPEGSPPAKERRIVAVGRFFRGEHDKRHDALIRAMEALAPSLDGWALHLVGGVNNDAKSAEHLAWLRASATDLPVEFHVNASAEERDDLYARSALFWHAAGLDVSPLRHPERLEHFGLTTVEAMAHGAVPLVVPEGGQAELVEDRVTGRHWRRIPELVRATAELAGNATARGKLSAAAQTAAAPYGEWRFRMAIRERILRG